MPKLETTSPLTPKQLAIMQLLAKGLTEKQVANTLALSSNTVSSHMHQARAKFRGRLTKAMIVHYMIQEGLVEVGEVV